MQKAKERTELAAQYKSHPTTHEMKHQMSGQTPAIVTTLRHHCTKPLWMLVDLRPTMRKWPRGLQQRASELRHQRFANALQRCRQGVARGRR